MKKLLIIIIFALSAFSQGGAYQKNKAAAIPVYILDTNNSVLHYWSSTAGDTNKLIAYINKDGAKVAVTGHGGFSPALDSASNGHVNGATAYYNAAAGDLNCNVCGFSFRDS